MTSMAQHVRAMLEFQRKVGGVRLRQQYRQQAYNHGVTDAFEFPVSSSLYPPAVLRGQGPFRWVALSGDPRNLSHRRGHPRTLPRRRALAPLVEDGP